MLTYGLYDIPNTCGPNWDICATFDFERPVSKEITSSNVAERSRTLLNQYVQQAAHYSHNHLLIPLGDDFKYKTADMARKMFTNYQKIFDYLNSHADLKVSIAFSTLSQYFAAVSRLSSPLSSSSLSSVSSSPSSVSASSPLQFPVFSGDFFPYSDRSQDYWTGYFTTRPFLKRHIRKVESLIKSVETLYSHVTLSYPSVSLGTVLNKLRTATRAVGLLQHHDGITGTARRVVVEDYQRILFAAEKDLWEDLGTLSGIVASQENAKAFDLEYPSPEGVTHPLSVPSRVVLHNSLGFPRKELIEVHVTSREVTVLDFHGNEVVSQVGPVWEKAGKVSTEKFSLTFLAEIPPLGFTSFSLRPTPSVPWASTTIWTSSPLLQLEIPEELGTGHKTLPAEGITMETDWLTLQFSPEGLFGNAIFPGPQGEMRHVTLQEEFLSYRSAGSGAYLFVPATSSQIFGKDAVTVHLSEGSCVWDLFVTFHKTEKEVAWQRVRVPKVPDLPISLTVRSDLKMFANQELTIRWSTSLKNEKKFFTDSNSFDLQQRQWNRTGPIPSNYYPISSQAILSDPEGSLTLLTAQGMGVGSLGEGQLEVMIDRRPTNDDGRGMGEGVTDNFMADLPMGLIIGPTWDPWENHRLAQRLSHPVRITHSSQSSDLDFHFQEQSLIASQFEGNLVDVSLRPSFSGELVLQLYNSHSSQGVRVNVQELFPRFSVSLLSSGQLSLLPFTSLLHFSVNESQRIGTLGPVPDHVIRPPNPRTPEEVTLRPKEARALLLHWTPMGTVLPPKGDPMGEHPQPLHPEVHPTLRPDPVTIVTNTPPSQEAEMSWLGYISMTTILIGVFVGLLRSRKARRWFRSLQNVPKLKT